jgi:ornithine carbamoyltransferase
MAMTLPKALDVDLRGRSLARVRDWTAAELEAVLDLADELKAKQRSREPHRLLEGRALGLLFRKHSTRTRVSLEVAAAHLGATALYLPDDQLQLARGEPAEDTARVLSRYLDAIAIRTFAHAELELFASAATIPVLNALTDEAHPLQALADLQTIRERFGAVEGLRVAWIGDGNNVCLSLAEACTLFGAELVCAAPVDYEPDDASIPVVRDPQEAVAGAHVVVTDVWTSMGQEAEREQRLQAFAGYTVDDELLALAEPEAIVLHCLPAHPGEEISADVLYGPRSAAWDEAENRLHTAQALLALTVA